MSCRFCRSSPTRTTLYLSDSSSSSGCGWYCGRDGSLLSRLLPHSWRLTAGQITFQRAIATAAPERNVTVATVVEVADVAVIAEIAVGRFIIISHVALVPVRVDCCMEVAADEEVVTSRKALALVGGAGGGQPVSMWWHPSGRKRRIINCSFSGEEHSAKRRSSGGGGAGMWDWLNFNHGQ